MTNINHTQHNGEKNHLTCTLYAMSLAILVLTGALGGILTQGLIFVGIYSNILLSLSIIIIISTVFFLLYHIFAMRLESNRKQGYDDALTLRCKVFRCLRVTLVITLLASIVAWFSNELTNITDDLGNATLVSLFLIMACAALLKWVHSKRALMKKRRHQWIVLVVTGLTFAINSWFEICQILYQSFVYIYFIAVTALFAIITFTYQRDIIDLINRKSKNTARKVLIIPLSTFNTEEDLPKFTFDDFADATKQLGEHNSAVTLAAIQKNAPALEHLVMVVSKTTTRGRGSVENYMVLAKFIEAGQKKLNIPFKIHLYCSETNTLVCCSEIEQDRCPTSGLDFSDVDIMKGAYIKLISLVQRKLAVKEYDIVLDVTAATKAVTVAGCLATLNTTVRNMYICTNKLDEFDGSPEKIDEMAYMYDFITSDVTKLT
ncbi:hypothetical protein EAG18_11515 [Pseudoalteromonas sp. J010]|uniref:hypothetical protein n=1 Tax=Pseudoalteromonas sp. J010 TaxID=998465 RepID=UPI000F647EC1|nr:hypothetical protein [Pseudoalteromonas sp. J010]RRS08617.1 hypothetical protein EAG18_11515 [Pseudoalteromonas sp. J010]